MLPTLLRLLILLGLAANSLSSRPPSNRGIRKLPFQLAHHLNSDSVTTLRDQYMVSTKKSKKPDSDTTESWWPLWRTSDPEEESNQDNDKEDAEPPKRKRRWGRPVKEDDEGDATDASKKDQAPAKNEKKKKSEQEGDKKENEKKRRSEQKGDKKENETKKKSEQEGDKKETEDSEDPKDKKKGWGRGKESELDESETSNNNSTSTNTTKSETREERKKREALERYKELHKLRQQIITGNNRGPHQMTPEEYQRHMRNANRDVAVVEIVASLASLLLSLGYKYMLIQWWLNRMEKLKPTQHFVFERVNDRFVKDAAALRESIDQPPFGVPKVLWNLVLARRRRFQQTNVLYGQSISVNTFERTSIIIELGENSDADMDDLRYLADVITFLLSQHQAHAFGTKRPEKQQRGDPPEPLKPLDLEIIFKVNSPGGQVTTFGLAAAQLARLRGVEGITTTACVDIIAASGGYMIASQANKLVAAPFAYIGSIGVIMETLNFHDILRNYGITPLVLKAGASKNPLTQFGPVSKKDIDVKEQEMEKIHEQFKLVTYEGRPQLQGIEQEVCDGSVFMGREAATLNLVDEVMTSDEYVMQRMLAGDRVLKVYRSRQSRLAPHLRNHMAHDILPHLKQRVAAFFSGVNSDTYATLLCAFAFLKHVMGKTRL